jgi:enterochelin esterase-like enzyme
LERRGYDPKTLRFQIDRLGRAIQLAKSECELNEVETVMRRNALARENARLREALNQISNDPISFDECHGTHDGTRWRKCQTLAREALDAARSEEG